MTKKQPVSVFVCITCDRDPARQDTPEAEGLGFLGTVKKLLPEANVGSVKCLGGCDAVPPGEDRPNGCCSVGFSAPGRHAYVFNKLNPATDGWKLVEFYSLYMKRPNGRIYCREHEQSDVLRPHVCTRIPPARED